MQIARALGGETDLERDLGARGQRGRALVFARALVIELEQDGAMVVAAGAGELPTGLLGQRVDLEDSLGQRGAADRGRPPLGRQPNRVRFERHGLARLGLHASWGSWSRCCSADVPTGYWSRSTGSRPGRCSATSISVAGSFRGQRRYGGRDGRDSARPNGAVSASRPPSRTGSLGARASRRDAAEPGGPAPGSRCPVGTIPDPRRLLRPVRDAVTQLEQEIRALRALVTDLRPAALDDLGVQAAIEDLAERARGRGLEVDLATDLAYERGREPDRHNHPSSRPRSTASSRKPSTTPPRTAEPRRAHIELVEDRSAVRVTVRDDGRGFDPSAQTGGFGLLGMRERVELLHGTLEIESSPREGTTITATFPTRSRRPSDRATSDRDRSGTESVTEPRA